MSTQTQQISQKQQEKSYKYSLAAGLASLAVGSLHPLDIIKTRFQSHDGRANKSKNVVPKYESIKHALQLIYKDEGFRGFYKGFVWSQCASSISRMLFFTIYENRKNYYKQKSHDHLSDRHITYASLQSGVIATIITTPLWATKTRMLLNTNKNITGVQNTANAIISIYKEHNVYGFWKGLSVSLPLCLHGVIQMNVFEEIIKFMDKHEILHESESKASIAGFMSKVTAIMVTYPLQTMRTRMQQSQYFLENRGVNNERIPKYKNVSQLVKIMVKKEGPLSFYKGVSASLIMNAPSQAIYFYCYQFLKNQMHLDNSKLH